MSGQDRGKSSKMMEIKRGELPKSGRLQWTCEGIRLIANN